jgi:hypothetical protein
MKSKPFTILCFQIPQLLFWDIVFEINVLRYCYFGPKRGPESAPATVLRTRYSTTYQRIDSITLKLWYAPLAAASHLSRTAAWARPHRSPPAPPILPFSGVAGCHPPGHPPARPGRCRLLPDRLSRPPQASWTDHAATRALRSRTPSFHALRVASAAVLAEVVGIGL